MQDILALSLLRRFKWVLIALTLAGLVYLSVALMKASKTPVDLPEEEQASITPPAQEADVFETIAPSSGDLASLLETRNIFSSAPTNGQLSPQTPSGQLPDNLKIVGIILGKPSQIIIEDTQVKQTYFLDEGTTQAGITVKQVQANQAVINFQGQDIVVPLAQAVKPGNSINGPIM